jgi:hypothetical protein
MEHIVKFFLILKIDLLGHHESVPPLAYILSMMGKTDIDCPVKG